MANRTTKSKATRSSKSTGSKKSTKATRTAARKSRARASVSAADLRRQMIAEAAYLRAQQRGFGSGDPLDDWLAAEREVDAQLTKRAHPSAR